MTDDQRRFQPSRAARTGGHGSVRTDSVPSAGDADGRGPFATDRAGAVVLGGRYVLQEELGEGAHAITWRAHDERLKRTVAIKVLRAHLSTDRELVARFVREAELAASISHPNVVDIYDVGTDAGRSYIVMRLVPGRDLRHVIDDEGRMPASRAVPLARQVLQGLGAIHAAGIVHRDVKPQNILITPDGTAQVTDFGVAYAALAEGLTTQGMTVGTASYMAPEQARGEPVTQATDVYAVGVVLYEMLTGRPPFTGENPMAIMLAHLQSRPVPPSERFPGLRVPPAVEAAVMRAMAKDPAQRFASTADMVLALGGQAVPGAGANASGAATVASPALAATAAAAADARTVVRPAVSTGAWPAAPPNRDGVDGPPWLRDSSGGGASPPGARPALAGGGGGRSRRWLIALAVLLFGAIALVSAAIAADVGPFGGGNNAPAVGADATRTPTGDPADGPGLADSSAEPTATNGPTATTTVGATETAPPTATVPRPTVTVAPTATVPPPPTATTPPTQTPPPTQTATAPPTATTPPIATATVPLATSTVPPPVDAQPAIVPTDGDDEDDGEDDGSGNSGNGSSGNGNAGNGNGNGNSGNGNSGNGNGGNLSLLSPTGAGATSLDIAPSDWQGAFTNLDVARYGQDCVALYGVGSGNSEATFSFTLDAVPLDGLVMTISGLDDEMAGGSVVQIAINGQALTPAAGAGLTFPDWNGQDSPEFTRVPVGFPPDPFVVGDNTITLSITGTQGTGDASAYPYVLLGAATISIAGASAGRDGDVV